LWGGVENLDILEGENVPFFLVHGEEDNIVPFKKGEPLKGIVPPNPLFSLNVPEMYGSFCIDTFLTNRQVPHKTWFVENKTHEFYGVNTGEFPETGPNLYWDSTIYKTSSFLFDQLQPRVNLRIGIDGKTAHLFSLSESNFSVHWDFGDGGTSNKPQTMHTYELDGEYKISLTVCNELQACNTASQVVNITSTGKINWTINNVKVFPNPVNSRLKISGINQPCEATVFDLSGRIQFVEKMQPGEALNMTGLKEGIYLLQLKTSDFLVIKKITKLH